MRTFISSSKASVLAFFAGLATMLRGLFASRESLDNETSNSAPCDQAKVITWVPPAPKPRKPARRITFTAFDAKVELPPVNPELLAKRMNAKKTGEVAVPVEITVEAPIAEPVVTDDVAAELVEIAAPVAVVAAPVEPTVSNKVVTARISVLNAPSSFGDSDRRSLTAERRAPAGTLVGLQPIVLPAQHDAHNAVTLVPPTN